MAGAAVLGGSLVALWLAWPLVGAAALLMDLAQADGWPRRWLPVRLNEVTTQDIHLPTRHGPIAARLLIGAGSDRTIVAFPGIHGGGVDEPRLARLTHRLAASGATVVSVPLPDLRAYRITPATTDVIEDVIVGVAGRNDLTPAGRVGIIGVSFSGGLAVVAAGRPAARDKVTAVISIGGHGDLPRVMTYLCTGRLADGTTRAPHDYGVAILLLAAIPRLVPPDQAPALEAGVAGFLEGSSLLDVDPAGAEARFASARAAGEQFAEPARTFWQLVEARDVGALGPRLLPFVEALGGNPALSPERSPPPAAPVFAVHGLDDNVIPAFETTRLIAWLQSRGHDRAYGLLTPMVSHADVQSGAGVADGWALLSFWARAWKAMAHK